MSDLREIIINATTEMLDNPGERGIYKTSKFYDRLETEIREYFDTQPKYSHTHDLISRLVDNSQYLGVPLQSAIAKYVEFLGKPTAYIVPVDYKLNNSKDE